MKLYIGCYDFNCFEIKAQGVKTLELAIKAIQERVSRIIVIKDLHTLLPKLLPPLFNLEQTYTHFYPDLEIWLHSKFLLPISFSNAYEYKRISEEEPFANLEPDVSKGSNMQLWFVWHSVARALNNNLITLEQAVNLFNQEKVIAGK